MSIIIIFVALHTFHTILLFFHYILQQNSLKRELAPIETSRSECIPVARELESNLLRPPGAWSSFEILASASKDMVSSKFLLISVSSSRLLSPPFVKAGGGGGGIKTHTSVCPSVRPSVTKTLTWLISSAVLMTERGYLACMILVSSPFN